MTGNKVSLLLKVVDLLGIDIIDCGDGEIKSTHARFKDPVTELEFGIVVGGYSFSSKEGQLVVGFSVLGNLHGALFVGDAGTELFMFSKEKLGDYVKLMQSRSSVKEVRKIFEKAVPSRYKLDSTKGWVACFM